MPALDPDLRIRVYKNTPVILNMYRPRPDECQKRLPAHRVCKHPGGVHPGKIILFLPSHAMLRRIMPC